MSDQIVFKTQIRIDCDGWGGSCSNDVWVEGIVTLEKTIQIPPDELDVEYGMNVHSCHASPVSVPLTWFSFADGYLCSTCYDKYNAWKTK